MNALWSRASFSQRCSPRTRRTFPSCESSRSSPVNPRPYVTRPRYIVETTVTCHRHESVQSAALVTCQWPVTGVPTAGRSALRDIRQVRASGNRENPPQSSSRALEAPITSRTQTTSRILPIHPRQKPEESAPALPAPGCRQSPPTTFQGRLHPPTTSYVDNALPRSSSWWGTPLLKPRCRVSRPLLPHASAVRCRRSSPTASPP